MYVTFASVFVKVIPPMSSTKAMQRKQNISIIGSGNGALGPICNYIKQKGDHELHLCASDASLTQPSETHHS